MYFIRIFTLFLFFILSTTSFLFGQNPDFKWVGKIGSPSQDGGNSIARDAAGNVYITGFFEGTSDFDPGPAVATLTCLNNWRQIYFAKYDPNGNFLWAKELGGTADDECYSITLDANNNVYITGYFEGTNVDFDTGSGTYTLSSNYGEDAFLAKYTASGNFVWAIAMGGLFDDRGFNIAFDPVGNPVITGVFSNTVDFDPGGGVANLTSAGYYDIFLAKYDVNGNYMWAKKFGSVQNDVGYGLACDASGNVLITGYFEGTVDFDPGPSTANLVGNLNYIDLFFAKYDPNGNYIWAKQIGGNNIDISYSIALDQSANIYLTGVFAATTDFDPGIGVSNLVAFFNTDPFVAKYDSNGNYLWAKQIQSSGGYARSVSVALDGSGNPVIAGDFTGSIDVDPGIASITFTSPGTYSDMFFAKYSASGNYLWGKQIGNTGAEEAHDVALDECGNVIITGFFNNTVDFDTGPAVSNLSAIGNDDIFFVKYSNITASAAFSPICLGQVCTLTASGFGNGASYTWTPGNVTGSVVTFTPASTTIYNVTGTATNGCVGSSSIQITVSSTPGPTVTVNSGSICLGNSFVMTPSGASTYFFQGGTATVSPLSNTSYTVVGVNSAGCISQNIATANVTVSALPLPTLSVNSGTVCALKTFTLNPSGASTYTFQGGSAFVSPGSTTTYSVIGTNSNGCVSTSFITSTVTVIPLPVISVNSYSICLGQAFTLVPTGANTYTFQGGSAVVSPTITTTYTVAGTSNVGCTSSVAATSTVTVVGLPIISVNSGSICPGNSFTIIPSGANSYTFEGGNAVVNPTVNTNYTVTGTAATGCVSQNFATSSVSILPLPNVSATSSGTMCVGQTATLTASGAQTYTWNNSSPTTTLLITPPFTSIYSVTGTDINNCVNTATVIQYVTICTDLFNNYKQTFFVKLFPNPCNSVVHIELEKLSLPLAFQITDMLGKVYLEGWFKNEKNSINTENLQPGIYFLTAGNTKELFRSKFLKN